MRTLRQLPELEILDSRGAFVVTKHDRRRFNSRTYKRGINVVHRFIYMTNIRAIAAKPLRYILKIKDPRVLNIVGRSADTIYHILNFTHTRVLKINKKFIINNYYLFISN